jgi:hypothetical protein
MNRVRMIMASAMQELEDLLVDYRAHPVALVVCIHDRKTLKGAKLELVHIGEPDTDDPVIVAIKLALYQQEEIQ